MGESYWSDFCQSFHLVEIHQELKEMNIASRASLSGCMFRKRTACDATIIVVKMAAFRTEILLRWINEFHHKLDFFDHKVSFLTLEYFSVARGLGYGIVIRSVISCRATNCCSFSWWFNASLSLMLIRKCCNNHFLARWRGNGNSLWIVLIFAIFVSLRRWIESFRRCHLLLLFLFNVDEPVQAEFVQHGELAEWSWYLDKKIIVQEKRF